jgi:cell volume regulation protein A
MLAGSEGLGGIAFEDYGLANGIAGAALAVILFDGGLRTSLDTVRSVWRPALMLSTVGVVITAALVGVASVWILEIPVLHGMLLGSIISSTDAAAVFSVLRTSRLKLPEKLASTLEIESGSNDPMAIFLTIGLIEVISGSAGSTSGLALLFVVQFGVGACTGLAVGRGAAWIINRVDLGTTGLYPILAAACGLLAFGLAGELGGSGFLAVYLAGIVLGNSDIVFRRGILLFHDAAAWFGQIVLFIMLGLLSFPSRLLDVTAEGLIVALVLIFIARPIAAAVSVLPFRFRIREQMLLFWGGLKGAVPITLATFPLVAGIEGSGYLFDVVFFVVLIAAITQGWSLPPLARKLGLAQSADVEPPVSVEINALRHVDAEIVRYVVAPSARVAGEVLRDLALPEGVVLTLVVRDSQVIMPRGATRLEPEDHVFVAMQRRLRPVMNRLFDPIAATDPLPEGLTLSFRAQCTARELHRFFGLSGPAWSEEPIGNLVDVDDREPVRLGPFLLRADRTSDSVILTYDPQEERSDVDTLTGKR